MVYIRWESMNGYVRSESGSIYKQQNIMTAEAIEFWRFGSVIKTSVLWYKFLIKTSYLSNNYTTCTWTSTLINGNGTLRRLHALHCRCRACRRVACGDEGFMDDRGDYGGEGIHWEDAMSGMKEGCLMKELGVHESFIQLVAGDRQQVQWTESKSDGT